MKPYIYHARKLLLLLNGVDAKHFHLPLAILPDFETSPADMTGWISRDGSLAVRPRAVTHHV
jgi:hypothetical protein